MTSVSRLVGFVRLFHPFPSLLDGGAVAVLATVAGAEGDLALRLAVAMILLQASIGALNDLVDARFDAGRKPAKPIPAGLVSPRAARMSVAATALLGVGLVAPSGPLVTGVAVMGLAVGFAYDLRLDSTPWSWLPWSLGIPLLPVYAWLGATGGLPPAFQILVPMGVLGGTALALSNALADLERDADAGLATVATFLGGQTTWIAAAALHLAVLGIGLLSLVVEGPWHGSSTEPTRTLGAFGLVGGGVLLGVGLGLGRRHSALAREIGWETQALGLGAAALGWLLALGQVA